MAAIEIFKNESFGEVRVAGTSEKPLFCLADVCKVLELGNPSQVKTRLDDGVISNEVIPDSLGRQQETTFVNEDGLYDVILDSRKPQAKAFRKWITSEVLPSIRKTGQYSLAIPSYQISDPIKRAEKWIEEEKQRQQLAIDNQKKAEKIEQDKPKVIFADAVSTSQRSCLVAELAKILKQNGVNIGQNRLFDWLRKHGYLCSKGQYYNQPTQRACFNDNESNRERANLFREQVLERFKRGEGCRMKTNIQYDFTSLNDFFNKFETPDEMMMDLAEVVMNYALLHDPSNTDSFKRDIGTVYVLYQEIKKLKEQQIA